MGASSGEFDQSTYHPPVSDPVIIHRSHYTQLHTWGKADTPKCTIETGILIHMLWCCPKLRFMFNTLNTLCSVHVHS